jgi:hypothetical protein
MTSGSRHASTVQIRRLNVRLIILGPALGWTGATLMLAIFDDSFFHPLPDRSGPSTLFLPQIAIIFGVPFGLAIGIFTAIARKLIAHKSSSIKTITMATVGSSAFFGMLFFSVFWVLPFQYMNLTAFIPLAGGLVATGVWMITSCTFRSPKPGKVLNPDVDWWR